MSILRSIGGALKAAAPFTSVLLPQVAGPANLILSAISAFTSIRGGTPEEALGAIQSIREGVSDLGLSPKLTALLGQAANGVNVVVSMGITEDQLEERLNIARAEGRPAVPEDYADIVDATVEGMEAFDQDAFVNYYNAMRGLE